MSSLVRPALMPARTWYCVQGLQPAPIAAPTATTSRSFALRTAIAESPSRWWWPAPRPSRRLPALAAAPRRAARARGGNHRQRLLERSSAPAGPARPHDRADEAEGVGALHRVLAHELAEAAGLRVSGRVLPQRFDLDVG